MIVPGQPVAHAMAAAPPVPVPVSAGPATTAGGGCPSCGAALPRGAVLCTKCGYNLATKQRTAAGRPTAPGRAKVPAGQAPWYKTPYPYIGVVLVTLGILYFLGKQNEAMMMAFRLVAILFYMTVHIMVLVAAFRESVGTGFLALCVPFYALYFVSKVSESQTLKILYTAAIVIGLTLKFVD
jgi:hypothetical protein